ncbi:LPXTG cell wall anchor domain-containing protein [Streptomyces sp. NPDC054841]
MAVAAATAVIAPAAFLAAPSAFADDTNGTTSTTSAGSTGTTGSTDGTTGGDATAGTTGSTDGTTGGDATTGTTGSTDGTTGGEATTGTTGGEATTGGDATTGTTGTTGGEATTGTTGGEATTGGDASTGTTGTTGGNSTTGATTGGDEEEPGEDDEDADEGECEIAQVDVKLSGFPNKIVAGGEWKTFSLDVKNNSKSEIKDFYLFTFASYEDELISDENQLIEKYAHFEYKGTDGKWTSGGNLSGANNGLFFDVIDLKKDEKRSIKMRLRIDKAAPAGKSLALAVGGYDKDETCYENGEFYEFDVLKSGSEPGDVDEAKPNGDKPKDVKPQGGAEEIPVTGNLAETGSSSVLPTIGIAGGIAIVAGAGVVFAMKRRKSDVTA